VSDTSYEPLEVCIAARVCWRDQVCVWERNRLVKEEELGQIAPPPCFASLLAWAESWPQRTAS
jgi:hypothetical protein